MSGGVDSSMTALLMQKAGYECIGVHMQLTSEPGPDAAGARIIADRLGIPFHIFDLSERFHDEVILSFVEGYESGETPNPCIACNRHLKFDALLQIADQLDCQHLATGHYAQIEHDALLGRWVVRTAVDTGKDQSYVLYTLTQKQLARVILPLGSYCKSDVRKMAAEAGFPNAGKTDSQDICFVPNGDYAGYIETYRGEPCQSGDMLDGEGRVVGRHKGLIHYTIGQRKGLGAHGRPVFVQAINAEDNTLTIGDDEGDLLAQNFLVRDYNGVALSKEELSSAHPISCSIKVGYKHSQKPGTIEVVSLDNVQYVRVTYDQPQRAITPGQSAVFYNGNHDKDGDKVLGGGIITCLE